MYRQPDQRAKAIDIIKQVPLTMNFNLAFFANRAFDGINCSPDRYTADGACSTSNTGSSIVAVVKPPRHLTRTVVEDILL